MSAHAHRTKCCKNVIRKLHNNSQLIGLMALLQTFRNIRKYCNLLSVLQAQTHTNCPQNTNLSIFVLQIQVYWWQVFRDNDRSRQRLIGQTYRSISF